MEPLELVALLTGIFFLSFGLAAYRQFFRVLGLAAGLALWSAFRETLVRLPGLKEHPGTAAVLLLILLCATGVFLVTRFRRVFAFLGGFGTGIILSGIVESYFTGGSLFTGHFRIAPPDPMDLLAGLVGGVLFLLFERFFALILTTSLGAFLFYWAIGGRWTFVLCFLIGFMAQLLIFARIRNSGKGRGDGSTRSDSGKKE
jgi:hypothetical protein